MVKGARQREWPHHLSTHTHTHGTLPTTMSVLETPFDIHVSSVYQTHTCMQAPIPTLCISAKKTHSKGSRTRPIMSILCPGQVYQSFAVELRCHATALIKCTDLKVVYRITLIVLVIGKAQFRRAMLSCDSSCYQLRFKRKRNKLKMGF